MDIEKISMVEAVKKHPAQCLMISMPLAEHHNNKKESEENQNKNLSQIFQGKFILHIGNDRSAMTGQQPDLTIWKEIDDKNKKPFTFWSEMEMMEEEIFARCFVRSDGEAS